MIRVGDKLKEERIRRGLSLQDVSGATKIRINFLEHIEAGEYEKLPSVTFAQGFVRNYVLFLGLPEKETMALFRREFDEEKVFRVLPEGMAREEFPVRRIKLSQFFLIGILFIALIGFLLFQYKDAIVAPAVSITTPLENQVYQTTTIEVLGKTNPDNTVFVNSFPVSVREDGTFRKVLSIFQGKNTIEIRVVNRFNKITEIKRQVEVK